MFMRIAVIQASSQVAKNELIYSAVKKYAADADRNDPAPMLQDRVSRTCFQILLS